MATDVRVVRVARTPVGPLLMGPARRDGLPALQGDRMRPACTFCGRPISVNRDYRKVTGWERRRAAGGTNALRLRYQHDEWACESCVNKEARGLNHGQQGMFA